MKILQPKDYINRVYDKVSKDVPSLRKSTVHKIISLYIQRLRLMIRYKRHLHIDGWFKIQPHNKERYLEKKKYRTND